MAEASLQPIYERLHGADGYHPFSANTFTDWAIEAGDIVTITRESESFTSPVHSSHLSWRGSPQMTLQSRGKKELDSIGKSTQKKFAKSGGAYRAARNVARKASVYFQKQNPLLTPGIDVHKDDIWVESDMLNTWDDIGELTWDELGDYTWLDFYGCKMYAYDGSKWVEIMDEQKSNYNFDLFRNTRTELNSLKGDFSGAFTQIYQDKQQMFTLAKDTRASLESLISQTAGQIRTEVKDTKNGLESSISQTAGQIRSEVTDSVNGLQSSISQTAGEIRSEVSDSVNGLQSSITEQANRISLVVQGTGSNAKIKPAAIVAAINAQTGTSLVKLSADVIELDGEAIADALLGTSISVIDVITDLISVSDTLEFASDSGIRCGNGTLYDAANIVVNASVSGNTLTLYTLGSNTPITFSKATTLSSSWSGSNSSRILTMTAKQNNTTVATRTVGFGTALNTHDIDLTVDSNGTPTAVTPTGGVVSIDCPVKIAQLVSSGSTTYYTKNVRFNPNSLLQSKSVSSNGDVTPDSGYIGLSKVTVSVPQSYSWGTQNWVSNTNNLPAGTKHTVNNLKNVIVNYRGNQGYIYFTININGTTHVFYFVDNGNNWTS